MKVFNLVLILNIITDIFIVVKNQNSPDVHQVTCVKAVYLPSGIRWQWEWIQLKERCEWISHSITGWTKPDTESYILYDSTCVKCKHSQNDLVVLATRVLPHEGSQRWDGEWHSLFLGLGHGCVQLEKILRLIYELHAFLKTQDSSSPQISKDVHLSPL